MAEKLNVYYRPDDHSINEARRVIGNPRTNPYKDRLVSLSRKHRIIKVAGLVEILGYHHPNTLIHSFEDTLLALSMAEGILGKPNQNNLASYVEVFEDGLLHDIGKIGVPRKLLNVQDRSILKPEERQIIRMHGAYGGAVLELAGLGNRAYISYEHDLASGTEKTWKGVVDLNSRHELTEIISLADLIGGLMDPRRPYHHPIAKEYMFWIVNKKGHQGVYSEKLIRSFREHVHALELYPPFTLDAYKKNRLFMALINKYGLNDIFQNAIGRPVDK